MTAAMNKAETRAEHIVSALMAERIGVSASFGHETDFATKLISSRILFNINMLEI